MDNTMYKIEFGFAKYLAIGFYYDNQFVGRAIQIILPFCYLTLRMPIGAEAKTYPWKLFKFNG